MKTIFKSTLLLTALGLTFLTSCKDDNESNPTLTQPQEFVLNDIDINGTVELENTKSVTLTWSQPTPYNNFNSAMVPTYTVEISPTGAFTKAFDANVEDNTGADFFTLDQTYNSGADVVVSTETIDRSLVQLCGWSETTVPSILDLSIRVKSVIKDASFREYNEIYSNVINLSTVPYYIQLKEADPEIWWLIGGDIADGSWGDDYGKCIIPLQTIEDNKYDKKTGQGTIQWIGYLGGNGFKLKQDPASWDVQIGQNDGGFVKNDGGSGNITVDEPGIYVVTLKTDELAGVEDKANTTALTIEKYEGSAPVFDGMAIAGSFNSWGDTAMEPCSTGWENHDWYVEQEFAAGDEVKIKQAGTWDFNKGGKFVEYSEGMYAYGVNGGDNLKISEAGKYLILFNDITGYIRFIKK